MFFKTKVSDETWIYNALCKKLHKKLAKKQNDTETGALAEIINRYCNPCFCYQLKKRYEFQSKKNLKHNEKTAKQIYGLLITSTLFTELQKFYQCNLNYPTSFINKNNIISNYARMLLTYSYEHKQILTSLQLNVLTFYLIAESLNHSLLTNDQVKALFNRRDITLTYNAYGPRCVELVKELNPFGATPIIMSSDELQNTPDDYFLRLVHRHLLKSCFDTFENDDSIFPKIAYFKKSVAEPYPRKPLPLKWSQFDEFRQSLVADNAPINIELTW